MITSLWCNHESINSCFILWVPRLNCHFSLWLSGFWHDSFFGASFVMKAKRFLCLSNYCSINIEFDGDNDCTAVKVQLHSQFCQLSPSEFPHSSPMTNRMASFEKDLISREVKFGESTFDRNAKYIQVKWWTRFACTFYIDSFF